MGPRQSGSRNDVVPLVVGDDKAQPSIGMLEGPISCDVAARATPYGHTFALLVPRAVIPEHEREDVIEVKFRRKSQPTREYVLYTTHKPGYKRAYLDLFQVAPTQGEEFVIGEVGKYQEKRFAAEYNAAKPKGLENTELLYDGKFRMKVDEKDVELSAVRLRTHQGQMILDAEMGGAGPVKIAKSLDGFAVRLRDHSPVTAIRMKSGGIVLTYARTNHDPYPHRRQVNHADYAERNQAPSGQAPLRFAVRQRWHDNPKVYEIDADAPTRALVTARLDSARDTDEFRKIKGDIGEELVRQALPHLGMTFVADHPVSSHSWLTGSERPGPDQLHRINDTRELCYIEAKWWGKADNAYLKAKRQALRDLQAYPTFRGERVTASCVAIVNWRVEEELILLELTRITPEA